MDDDSSPRHLFPRGSAVADVSGAQDLGAPGHPSRGVSIQYISTSLLREAEEAGLSDPRVYEFEPTIRLKGEYIVCPRDLRQGAAYVDCSKSGDAGHSSVMLSYTWEYKISDIANGLQEFCNATQNPTDLFVWICCLCVNQHRVTEARAQGEVIPFEQFKATFETRVSSIGRVVALMAPWEHPYYITRVWCVFEMFTAISKGCEITITMPSAEAGRMREAILACNLSKLWEALLTIRSETANASCEEDRINIMRIIRDGPGFASLDAKVAETLKQWILSMAEQHLEQCRATENKSGELAKLLHGVGVLFRRSGNSKRAVDLLTEAKAHRMALGMLDTKEGAHLLKDLGSVKGAIGNYKEQLEEWDTARQFFTKTDTLKTIEGANLLRGIGDVKRQEGDLHGALAAMVEAQDVLESIGCFVATPEGARVMRSMGNVRRDQGALDEALRLYVMAKEVREASQSLETPEGAQLLTDMASVRATLGQLGDAREDFEWAVQIRTKTRTLETAGGALLITKIGDAEKHEGHLEVALAHYRHAQQIYMASGQLNTRNGRKLVESLSELELSAKATCPTDCR